MPIPALSIAERHDIDTGPWFAKLSPPLRQAIERAGALRIEPTRLVALSRDKLPALSEQA